MKLLKGKIKDDCICIYIEYYFTIYIHEIVLSTFLELSLTPKYTSNCTNKIKNDNYLSNLKLVILSK